MTKLIRLRVYEVSSSFSRDSHDGYACSFYAMFLKSSAERNRIIDIPCPGTDCDNCTFFGDIYLYNLWGIDD